MRRGSSLESRDMIKGEKILESHDYVSPDSKLKRIGLFYSSGNQKSKLNLKDQH
jgi:hypothetical protein